MDVTYFHLSKLGKTLVYTSHMLEISGTLWLFSTESEERRLSHFDFCLISQGCLSYS
jgi:hypothetical protein